MFAEGASITNLDKLTVEEDAKIFVNYKMDEYGSESYEKHTHNTEATKGGTYIDSQKHYENVACKELPDWICNRDEGRTGAYIWEWFL